MLLLALSLQALDKALESLQRAMTLFPAKAAQLEHDTALTYEMRSMVRYNQGEYDCAMADARLALQYEPGELFVKEPETV